MTDLAVIRQAERVKVLRKIRQLMDAARLSPFSRTADQLDAYLAACEYMMKAVKRMR